MSKGNRGTSRERFQETGTTRRYHQETVVSQSQGKTILRVIQWFTVLISAKKSHKVSAENITGFSNIGVTPAPRKSYYGG
jgi:hypothetical protein